EDSLHGLTDEPTEQVDEHGLAEHHDGDAADVTSETGAEIAVDESFDIDVSPDTTEPSDADAYAIQELPEESPTEPEPVAVEADEQVAHIAPEETAAASDDFP